MKRIAIIGGGIAGVAAAYFLARHAESGSPIEVELFEATPRLGGIVETVREGGFIVECGPDAWVTEKPWALDLAHELGLADEVIHSLDEDRKTYVHLDGHLQAMPDGMRMMVPSDMAAVAASNLFSAEAKRAYATELLRAQELKLSAPTEDESVASFVARHFGQEVLHRIAAPLLGGVFGGDVRKLSVRAVMPAFVAMERQFGSLILAVQSRARTEQKPIFTSLLSGTGTLVDRMIARIPPHWLHLAEPVKTLERTGGKWTVKTHLRAAAFDELFLATPIDVAQSLLKPVDPATAFLMDMESSSAVVAAFCFDRRFPLPPGFGFLVPPGPRSALLACTFTDQKFFHRVPPGSRLIRAFFGGATADRLLRCRNDEIASIARLELGRLLGDITGPLPEPVLTVIRRWPRALPQYAVGHLDRMAQLDRCVQSLGHLHLLGNAYRGVGLPDLIRDARSAAIHGAQ